MNTECKLIHPPASTHLSCWLSLCSVVLEVDLELFGQWRRALFSLLIGYDPKAIPIVQVRPAMNLFCQPSQSKTKLPSRDSVL